jgi:hypothetical protein
LAFTKEGETEVETLRRQIKKLKAEREEFFGLEARAWKTCVSTLMGICNGKREGTKKSDGSYDGKLYTEQTRMRLDAAKELCKTLKGDDRTKVQLVKDQMREAMVEEVGKMSAIEEVEEYLQEKLEEGLIDEEEFDEIVDDAKKRLSAA